MQAAMSILAALLRRERNGEGACLDVAITDGMLNLMSLYLDQYLATGEDTQPGSGILTGRADPVAAVFPAGVRGFQWHYYTFDGPDGATLLASSEAANQSFRVDDHAWAIQFHAEVTREMAERWTVTGEAELPQPIDEMRAETDRLLGPWNRHGRALCTAFLDVAAAR